MGDCPRQHIDLAVIWWRQNRLLKQANLEESERKKLQREVDRLYRTLRSSGIEVNDFTGQRATNLNVDAVSIEPDATVQDEIVYETISPEIVFQNEVVRKSRVVIHKPAAEVEQLEGAPSRTNSSQVETPQPPSQYKHTHAVAQHAAAVSTAEATPKPEHAPIQTASGANPPTSSPANPSNDQQQAGAQHTVLLGILTALSALAVILAIAILYFQYGANRDIASQNEQLTSIENHMEAQIDSSDSNEDDVVDKEESNNTDNAENSGDDQGTLILYPYTVNAGDTLLEICLAHGLDYSSLDFVCRINGIDNPDLIYEEQVLYLPSIEGANHEE